ncbi:MAG TPA: YlxR family protein [Chloroflexota bacterium]
MAPPSRGSRPRHIPQRTCIACRQSNAKRQLIRIVRAPDGSVTIDPSGKRSGRGAYLCDSPQCWRLGLGRGILSRALKIESVPRDNLQTLTEYAQHLDLLVGARQHEPSSGPGT